MNTEVILDFYKRLRYFQTAEPLLGYKEEWR